MIPITPRSDTALLTRAILLLQVWLEWEATCDTIENEWIIDETIVKTRELIQEYLL